MHVVIYGAGAIGGVIGAHLFSSGTPTTLIARGRHLEAIRTNGLVLDTAQGREALQIPTAATASEIDWTDESVVFLCVKSQQTAAALEDLRFHAPPMTPIVSAQNGVANEPAILRLFPNVYSLCVVLPALHLDPGVVIQLSDGTPGLLDIGRYPTGFDDTAEIIAARLRAASFPSKVRGNITAWKYRKLITYLVNGVDATYRNDGPAHHELVRRARSEGEAVLDAADIEVISEEFDIARRADFIKRRDTGDNSYGSSTWQSVERGAGSLEVDYLAGEIVLLGRLNGVPTPVNELVQAETVRLVRDGLPAASLDAQEALARVGVTPPTAE